MPRFLEPHQDRPLDPRNARPPRVSSKSKGRRCTRSPAAPRPGHSKRTTTRSISTCSCGSRSSCISSGCWSAASSASTSSAASIATKASAPTAQSRIHDARGLPGLRRLPLDDGPDRGLHRRRDSRHRPAAASCRGATRRSTSRRPFARKTYDELFQRARRHRPDRRRRRRQARHNRSASKPPASIPT